MAFHGHGRLFDDDFFLVGIDWENHVRYQWGYQIYQIRVSMSIIRIIFISGGLGVWV